MDLLEQSAKYLEMAERYEVMGEVYKIVIPLYEQERDFRVCLSVNITSQFAIRAFFCFVLNFLFLIAHVFFMLDAKKQNKTKT